MTRSVLKSTFVLVVALLAVTVVYAAPVTEVTFDNCDINLKLDIPSHAATFDVSGIVEAAAGWNAFKLAPTASIEMFSIDRKPVAFLSVKPGDSVGLPSEIGGGLSDLDIDSTAQVVLFKSDAAVTGSFLITYHAEFLQDAGNMRFSNERVGGEVTGTIVDKGAYLSSGGFFYPQGKETLSQY